MNFDIDKIYENWNNGADLESGLPELIGEDASDEPFPFFSSGGEFKIGFEDKLAKTGDIRVDGDKLIRKDTFFHAVQLGRDAAGPTQSWLNQWNPADYQTMSDMRASLGKMPRELNAVFDHSMVADNPQTTFLEPGNQKLVRQLKPHREVEYIGKTWLGEEDNGDGKEKTDGCFPLLLDHLGSLRRITGKPVIRYECYGCAVPKRFKQILELDEIFEVPRERRTDDPTPDCRVIGDFSEDALICPPPSVFYLSILHGPVGASLNARRIGNSVSARFVADKGKYCLDLRTAIRAEFCRPNFTDDVPWKEKRWIHSYFPYNPKYLVWKKGDDRSIIENPYAKAYVIVATLPSMSAPLGELLWKVEPAFSPGRRVPVLRSPGVRSDSSVWAFAREKGDSIVRFFLERKDDSFCMKVEGEEGTLSANVATSAIVPRNAKYRGYAVYRRGYMVNPIVSDGYTGPATSSLNSVPYHCYLMMEALGGFKFNKWFPQPPSTPRMMWYSSDYGSCLFFPGEQGGKMVDTSPFSIVPTPLASVQMPRPMRLDLDDNVVAHLYSPVDDQVGEPLERMHLGKRTKHA